MDSKTNNISVEGSATLQNNVTAKLLDKLREEASYLNDLENHESRDECECVLYHDGKIEEIKRLRKQVDDFRNDDKHFTKEHRTLYGHCFKLQVDLDNIDSTGRDDLKLELDKSLKMINEITDILKTKVHADGKSCGNCPIND